MIYCSLVYKGRKEKKEKKTGPGAHINFPTDSGKCYFLKQTHEKTGHTEKRKKKLYETREI